MGIGEIITLVCSIVGTSSIISGLILRRIDKLEGLLERRESDRVNENIARGDLIHASGKLAEANTLAIRAITSEEACLSELIEYRSAADKLEHFMREKSAEYLHAS
ncbi:MAG: hypothetical protein IJY93_07685 [Clostridia bacterium]|nr:hypothetical protein [Clostridia bacterium]